jgi:hypothetical protein
MRNNDEQDDVVVIKEVNNREERQEAAAVETTATLPAGGLTQPQTRGAKRNTRTPPRDRYHPDMRKRLYSPLK